MTLDELARAAEAHAREEHGATLDVGTADAILRAEREPGRVESLAACYGAWLGRRIGGRWVGLLEPVAPRMIVGGRMISPIDAVRRRLTDASAPSLEDVLKQIEEWVREERSRTAAPNREAWDRLAGDPRYAGWTGAPFDPAALDEWLPVDLIRGKDLLCLAAGGGRQGPLHAQAGARVTVVDVSDRQLDHDRRAAAALGLEIRTVCASMDDLSALAASSFDVVVQPVSACYAPDVGRVYAEVGRVLRPGGLYVVQHQQPHGGAEREPGMVEFAHSLDTLLGGLCRAGFVIEDFTEPPRGDALAPPGSAAHRAWLQPPYLKIKARKKLEA